MKPGGGIEGLSIDFVGTKKRRHERSSCSCREASDATYFQMKVALGRLSGWNKYKLA
jgi:hypothetical protein